MLAVQEIDFGAWKVRVAIEADDAMGRAMQFDDLPTACLLMQAVGVLRDDGPKMAALLQVHQRPMAGIRLSVRAPVREAVGPVLGRVCRKRIDVRDLVGIELGPEPAFAPKVRDAVLYRDARAGERDRRPRRLQQRRGLVQRVIDRRGHRSPANRSSSGTGASTELRARSNVSSDQALGPSAWLSLRNQVSSGICVRCARMAASFLSM